MMAEPIIGGMFGLEEALATDATPPPFLREGSLLLLNARCGIRLLVERLSPQQTWMPSYLCGAMLDAVDPRVTRLQFFPIDEGLAIESRNWLNNVRPGDLVFFVDYFGFPLDQDCAREVRQRGGIVVEDACQALLSGHVGECADFVLYSPRKFVGVPDGGVLEARKVLKLPEVLLGKPPERWRLKAVEAAVLRREFDRCGGERDWFRLFREVEDEYPVGHYAMSDLSAALLRSALDYVAIARRRRENYQTLADALGRWAVLPDLQPDVVPLGFPIRCKSRDVVRERLFSRHIYPPVHWDIRGRVPDTFLASHRLSLNIMTLPCDQRYDRSHLARLVSSLSECGMSVL